MKPGGPAGGRGKHRRSFWRSRIGRRLLFAILLFSSLVTLVITIVDLYGDYRVGVATIGDRMHQIETGYSASLGDSLWNLDRHVIDLQLMGISRLPDVRFVEIRDTVGSRPFVREIGTPLDGPGVVRDITLVCHCGGDDRTVGVLHVEVTLDNLYRGIFVHALYILASQAVKTFLVATFILFVIHRMVTRHLLRMAATLAAPAGDDVPRLSLSGWGGEPDELDQLAIAFNDLGARFAAKQHQIAASNVQLAAILDNIPVGVITIDSDGRVVHVNGAMMDVLGQRLAAGDLFDLPFEPGGKSELSHNRPDGGAVAVLARSTPVYDTAGQGVGVVTVVVDITERKRTEERLRETSLFLETLLGNLPGVVFRMYYPAEGPKRPEFLDGVVARRDSLARVMGWSPEKLQEMFHPDDRRLLFEELPRRLRRENEAQFLVRAKSSGTWRWMRGWERVVERRGDEFWTQGVSIDVTDEIEAKKALEERERQLANSHKMEALGLLSSSISHDFNNLLGAILGFGRFILEDTQPGQPVHTYAGRIVAAGERGKALVSQILSYVRRSEPRREGLLLGDLLEEIRILLQATIPATTSLEVRPPAEELAIEGDRAQMTQVLLNLGVNAHDALGGQPGTVTIEARRTVATCPAFGVVPGGEANHGLARVVVGHLDPGIRHVSLVVSDTGCGMDAELMEKVFAPFFTTKRKGQGTGLGLAVVHDIVLAHGGALVVESQPGRGTVFEVVLPRSVPVLSPQTAEAEAPSPDRARGKVLLVDDDPDFGHMLLAALERRDFDVTFRADPVLGLADLRDEAAAWDALVTDHTMPGMTGLELIEAARAVRPGFPCFLVTGHAEDGLDDAALARVGVTALLHKPVDPAQLAEQLVAAIG